ncbi:hypothetical protein JIR23_27795 [Bradyrhizobium diazoefficiens]|nr:hypothetical protein [Bradyrhizobium diazoefficiens]QQN63288.1 hypothetical protein JIR23_27795 [Bradyrhizobium diazoefficiens]
MAEYFAGFCIYCGVSKGRGYAKALRTEHIVPLALNGDMELREATCEHCEKITGKAEQLALRGHYRGLRTQPGWKHRNKVEQPSELPVFVPNPDGGRDIRLMIPLAEYPHVHFFFDLPTPGILLGVQSGWEYGPKHRWMRLQARDVNPPVTSEKLSTFATPSLDLHSFCRMLAKIGHAYAIAKVGLSSFAPLLPPLILGDSIDCYRLVGGFPQAEELPALDKPYAISLLQETAFGKTYLVAKTRIFASIRGSRSYQTVVGEISAGPRSRLQGDINT